MLSNLIDTCSVPLASDIRWWCSNL